MEDKLKEKGKDNVCPVACIIKDQKILVGFRHYKNKWKNISVWTMPGGRCDEGETIGETIKREIYEEVGIKDLDFVDYLGEVLGANEGDVVPVFLCKTDKDYILMEPEKFSEWAWKPLDELLKMDNFINNNSLILIKNYLNNN